MIKYFRLIRLPNVLIIILTQVLVRCCLILPAFKAEYFVTGNFPQYLSDTLFTLLVASTVLIAIAGNIINDYFDIYIDEVNKPGKNIIGSIVSKKYAKLLYYVLSGVGVIIAFVIALKIGKPVIGIIPLFCAVSLWMYSSYYKRRMITGNLIVALLTAISVMLPGLYEPEFYRNFIFLLWFVALAFLISLIREMIKDIEDIDGDELSQCKTVPIVLGIPTAKKIIAGIIIITLIFIYYILRQNFYVNKVISFWYLIGIFYVPFVALLYLVATASEKKDYHYASLFSKLIMLGGIFSIYFFYKYFLI